MNQLIVIALALASALPVLSAPSSPAAEHSIWMQPSQSRDARDVWIQSEDTVRTPSQTAHTQEDGSGDYAARTAVAGVETLRRFFVSSFASIIILKCCIQGCYAFF